MIRHPPCGSISVDDKGEGLGGLFGSKKRLYSILTGSPYLPPPPKKSEIHHTLNYSISKMIQHPPCGPIEVNYKGEGLGGLFGSK